MERIAVVTLTRRRPHLLRRAISSVAAQVCSVPSLHFVAIDDCPPTAAMLESCSDLPRNFDFALLPREPLDRSGPARSAILRNACVRRLAVDWISFLDDDNEIEPDHLESLWRCAHATGCRAVHSWLHMFHSDGRPFLDEMDPWTRDPEAAREKFRRMVTLGVRSPGSNLFRDRADPKGAENPVRTVDTSAWLLRRDLLLEAPVPEQYSDSDWETMTTEDDKLLAQLIERGEPTACSRRATLRYYLGGYSNTGRLL